MSEQKETEELKKEIKELRVNTVTKLFILLLLYDGQKHGYELMKKLNKMLPFKVSPEQVYPFLRTLKEKGLAKIVEQAERDKKKYELTEKGKETVGLLLDRFSNLIQIAITPQVNVCAHCGVKIIGTGHKEVIDGEELVFCCKHCAEHYKAHKQKFKARK